MHWPSYVTIYLPQGRRWASSGQISVAAAGRGMKTCLCFLRQSPSPEPRRWMRSHGSCWRHLDPATGQLLSQDKLRDDGVTARGDDQYYRVVSLLQNTGWPQKRQISRFAHCRERACLFSKVSRTFHSAGWRLLSHNVPWPAPFCIAKFKFKFSSHQISRQFCCFTWE